MKISIELLIAILSLLTSVIVGVLTALVNIRISKINNTESIKKYNKEITAFELQFKDERWLKKILDSGEFNLYSVKSKQRIVKWWTEYIKYHQVIELKSQFPQGYDIMQLSSPGPNNSWVGSSGLVDNDEDNQDLNW